MFDPDLAAAIRRHAYDLDRQLPKIPPGTTQEEAALASIDRQRRDEQRAQRRRGGPRRIVRL